MAKTAVERGIATVGDLEVRAFEHVRYGRRRGGVSASLLDNCEHVLYKRLEDDLSLDWHQVSAVFRHR